MKRKQTYREILQKDINGFLIEHEFIEGGKSIVQTSRYERNPQLRAAAIDYHGTKCMVCNFDFGEVYGPHGEDYIEVHHLSPVSESSDVRRIDPRNGMAVVCSNCHRMIHRRHNHILSVEKLKEIISTQEALVG